MYKFEFTNKAPSIVQIKMHIKKARKSGYDFVQLTWGENEITLEKLFDSWVGYGWIKRIGGDDLAREINKQGA